MAQPERCHGPGGDRAPSCATPLQRHGVLRSDSLDTIREHMCRVLVPHGLTADRRAHRLDFRHSRAVLPRLSISYVDYGSSDARICVDAPVIDRTILLRLSLAGISRVSQGADAVTVSPGQFFAINDALPFRSAFSGDLCQLIVKLDARDLEAALWRDLDYVGRQPLRFRPVALQADAEARLLHRMLLDICEELNAPATLLRRPGPARRCEDMLFSAILHSLPHNYSEALARGATSPAAPYYVRRAEDFLRERACETVTMGDLVRAAGCSARSLHAGFRRFRETTPFAMLREIRLQTARLLLVAPSARHRSVADIAHGCGFTHLSKFSCYYKARFGELPSQTRMAAPWA